MRAIGKAWLGLVMFAAGLSLPSLTAAAAATRAVVADSPPEDLENAAEASVPAESRRIDQAYGNAWLGAADGDITLVVFVDYACPACREAQPVIDQLIAADPRLKVVYRILINEDGGKDAARTSLAVAGGRGSWAAFHRALDAAQAPDAAAISAALKTAAIDPPALPNPDDAEWLDSPILAELMNNDGLISQRRGKAVPAWVIGGGDALNGFELPALQHAIAEARRKAAPKS